MIRWLLLPAATAVAFLAAPGFGWRVIVLAAGATAYAADIALWPMLPCSHCGGSGKRVRPGGKAYGACRWCRGGDKQKVRLGRRLFANRPR